MAPQRGPHLAALCWPFSDENLRIYPRALNSQIFYVSGAFRNLVRVASFFHPDNFPKFIKGWQGFIFLKAFLLKHCVELIKVTQGADSGIHKDAADKKKRMAANRK